jgi:hypothetical protein
MLSDPVIVGFCGPMGCGKSTAAAHLVNSYSFVRTRFAGPLKAMMKALGLTDAEIDGHLKETPCELLGGKTPRHAMQTLGTEWGRNLIDGDLWVRAWRKSLPDRRDVVVDDVRFPNEARMVRSMNGLIIQIEREGTGGLCQHASELQGITGDITIKNNGSRDDLFDQLDWCLQTFWTTGKVA